MAGEFDLVFEGGGAKGTVFVGALRVFEERGCTARRLVGTSAGAIAATLLAAGYKAAPAPGEEVSEFERAALERDANGRPVFEGFMDIPTAKSLLDDPTVLDESLTQRIFQVVDFPGIPDFAEKMMDRWLIRQLMKIEAYRELFSFIELGGLYAGKRFRDWMRSKLASKGFDGLTLAQFFDKTGRDLSLLVTDTTAHELRVLNHRTAPACPVDMAVRMSMSIPFVFQEVVWDPAWGPYQEKGKPVEDLAGHTMVDGGALSNFPLHLVTSNDTAVEAVMGDVSADAADTMGLLIDETLSVDNCGSPSDDCEDDEKDGLLGDRRRLKTIKRVTRLINTMMEAHDKQVIEAHADVVCRLPAKGYGTTEFDMSDSRKDALIKAGRRAMEAHLEKRGV